MKNVLNLRAGADRAARFHRIAGIGRRYVEDRDRADQQLENQPPTLGSQVGIFKKHGSRDWIRSATQGAGETLQPVIAGSADLGVGVGVAARCGPSRRALPVRALLPGFTGTGDLYWYVKADSPIKSLKDATEKTTIAYSTSGSSSNNIVIAFVNELGAKGKPTATGGLPGTLTAVMSGQVDIGWAAAAVWLEGNRGGHDPHHRARQRRPLACAAETVASFLIVQRRRLEAEA